MHPNYKADEFLSHFNTFSLEAGENLSVDEKDQQFEGRGEGTVRGKHKKEGDRCFMDSTCERWRTATFCPRNQSPLKKWHSKGHSPSHSRFIFMHDQL